MTPTELVERVIALGYQRLDEALELLDRTPSRWSTPPAAAARPRADRRLDRRGARRLGPEVPEPLTTSMAERGDTVLVFGQLRIPHNTGRRFVEMQQIAFVYEVSATASAGDDVQVVGRGAGASGIEPGTPPTRRFRNWQLAIGGPPPQPHPA